MFLVILILLFATAYYFLSGRKDNISVKQVSSLPTANQKEAALPDTDIFTDAQGIVTFRYPKGATQTGGASPTELGYITFQIYYDSPSAGITFTGRPALPDEKKMSWDQYKSTLGPFKTSDYFEYSNIKEFNLSGGRAVSARRDFVTSGKKRFGGIFIEARHGDFIYEIGFGGKAESIERVTNAYNIFLQTFRFLK